jgi:Flp pilus assembly protein TadD
VKTALVVVASLLAVGCSPEEAKHKAAGNVLFKQGDLAGAEKEYRAALAANPKDPNSHTLLGNVLFEEEKWTEARAEFQTAIDADPKARAALQGLALIDLRQKDLAGAKKIYERMVTNEPRDTEAHAALGKLLLDAHDLDGAERHLREALVYAQNDPSSLYALGLVLAKKKDQVQANAIFDRLDRATPGKAYAPYGRAVAAAVSGQNDEACKWLAVALERGIDDLGQVEGDESFATLKNTPKFQELLAQARSRAPPKKGSPGP